MLNIIVFYLFTYRTFATNLKRRNSEDDEFDFYFKRYKYRVDNVVIDEFVQSYESFINPNHRSDANNEYINSNTNDFEAFSFGNSTQNNELISVLINPNEMINNLIGVSSIIETVTNLNEDKNTNEDTTATNLSDDKNTNEDNSEDAIDHRVNEKDDEEEILVVTESSSDIEILQENLPKQKAKDDDVTILEETINIAEEGVVLHLTIKDTNEQVIIQTKTLNTGTDNKVIQKTVSTNDNNGKLTIQNTVTNNENMANSVSGMGGKSSANDPCTTYSSICDSEKPITKDTVKMKESSGHGELYTKQVIHNKITDHEVDQVFNISEDNSEWLSLDNFAHGEIDQQAVDCILDMSERPYSSGLYAQEDVRITDLNCEEQFLVPKLNSQPSTSTQKINLQEEISKHVVNIESIISTLSSEENLQPATNVTSNRKLTNKQKITFLPYTSGETSIQTVPVDKNREIYLEIVLYMRKIINEKNRYCYLERLNGIKLMINHDTQYKLEPPEHIKSFLYSLDTLILQLFDLLNLREESIIELYKMADFDTFNFYISDYIHILKIYDIISCHCSKFEKEIYSMLKNEILQLYNYFSDFPELMTLGSLINKGFDEKLLLFLRIIQMLIKENRFRLVQIKPIILFIIKKLFLIPHNRTQIIELIAKGKFKCTKALIKRSLCDKDHSNFSFLMWEFDLEKLQSIKHHGKIGNEYIYDITVFNIEHYRVVFLIYLYQHLMFAEYHNLDYERYKNLFEVTITEFKCVFCMFNVYLELLRSDVVTINNRGE